MHPFWKGLLIAIVVVFILRSLSEPTTLFGLMDRAIILAETLLGK